MGKHLIPPVISRRDHPAGFSIFAAKCEYAV